MAVDHRGRHDPVRCLIVAENPGERVLVVNASFQSERYLHLKLLEHGDAPQPYTTQLPYGEIVDLYTLDDKRFLSLRTEQPFAIVTLASPGMTFEYPQAFQLAAGLATLTPADYDRAFLLTWGDGSFFQDHVGGSPEFNRDAGPMTVAIPSHVPALRRGIYGTLRIIPLSNADLAHLESFSLALMHRQEQSGSFPPLRSYSFLHRALSCHFCKP